MANIARIAVDFGKSFDKALEEALALEVKRRQDRIRRKIKTRVKSIIEFYVKTSPVGRSLRGGGGNPENSLQAELGLTDEAAQRGIERLIKQIQEIVRVSVKASRGTRTSNSSEITVQRLTADEIINSLNLSSDDFSYISNGTDLSNNRSRSYKIQWMGLVLKPDDGLVDQFIEDVRKPIVFPNGRQMYWEVARGNDQAELTSTTGKVGRSRSGFALMAPGGSFPYKIPSILLPRGKGKNFLEDVLRSRAFQRDIRQAIQDVVVEELRR